jgi:hypothetical protein
LRRCLVTRGGREEVFLDVRNKGFFMEEVVFLEEERFQISFVGKILC